VLAGARDNRRRGASLGVAGSGSGAGVLTLGDEVGAPVTGVRESFLGAGDGSGASCTPSSSLDSGVPDPAPSTIRAPRERSSPPRAMKRATRSSLVGSPSFSASAIDISELWASPWSPNSHWAAKSLIPRGRSRGPERGAGDAGAAAVAGAS
jgi:hypothetical protein